MKKLCFPIHTIQAPAAVNIEATYKHKSSLFSNKGIKGGPNTKNVI